LVFIDLFIFIAAASFTPSFLSNQIKKATELSPSHFKLLKDMRRNPIEEIGKAEEVERQLQNH